MLDILLDNIDGQKYIVDAYKIFNSENKILPCCDCRYCWKKNSCSINDAMGDIYNYLETSDNIIVATPVYFYSVPAPLKMIIDRFQVYWASSIRGDSKTQLKKKSVLLMVGGARNFENQFLGVQMAVKRIFDDINARLVGEVMFSNSDRVDIQSSSETHKQIISISKKLSAK